MIEKSFRPVAAVENTTRRVTGGRGKNESLVISFRMGTEAVSVSRESASHSVFHELPLLQPDDLLLRK